MPVARWTQTNITDQSGKTVVITGANSGLGYAVARVLAGRGAQLVLACRDKSKGAEACKKLEAEFPKAQIELLQLDLASLTSIKAFAAAFNRRYSSLEMLINNAGVMALPYRQTADNFEMQFGVNHLGHFALTNLLLPTILKSAGQARIVTVSSILHRSGTINFADLQGAKKYHPQRAYNQSKLANLLFAYELQRRLAASGANAISVAAHPGYAATNLQTTAPKMTGAKFRLAITKLLNRLIAQKAEAGALPLLYAATASGVQGGEYFGPDGFNELRGYPRVVQSSAASYDHALAEKLWAVSEELTGVRYSLTSPVPTISG